MNFMRLVSKINATYTFLSRLFLLHIYFTLSFCKYFDKIFRYSLHKIINFWCVKITQQFAKNKLKYRSKIFFIVWKTHGEKWLRTFTHLRIMISLSSTVDLSLSFFFFPPGKTWHQYPFCYIYSIFAKLVNSLPRKPT